MAIILAGSERKGLKSLAHRNADRDTPEQFRGLVPESTILDHTRQRVALAFPPERTMTVVTRAHKRFYEGSAIRRIAGETCGTTAKSRNGPGDALRIVSVTEDRAKCCCGHISVASLYRG